MAYCSPTDESTCISSDHTTVTPKDNAWEKERKTPVENGKTPSCKTWSLEKKIGKEKTEQFEKELELQIEQLEDKQKLNSNSPAIKEWKTKHQELEKLVTEEMERWKRTESSSM